jgi:hypothetical protein
VTGQLAQLARLRWQMVRTPGARSGFLALAAAVPVLCAVSVLVGALAPSERAADALVLAPVAYLSVAGIAVLAPLVAGGGNELFPAEQLVAYPVRPETVFAGSLVQAPLNLAWTVQLVGLLGLTSYVTAGDRWPVLALATCLAYVAAVTVAGQAIGWLVVGLRAGTVGRRATGIAAVALAAGFGGLSVTGRVTRFVEAAPSTEVVLSAVNGAQGELAPWAAGTLALVLLTVATLAVGRRACAWALRQPGRAATTGESARVRRRQLRNGAFGQLTVTDRASVWRSPSLRRGLLVLGLLPGLAAAAARLDWPSLVLLPGLVAAGAGLLFGVNAFCLDGPGALWLGSLPHRSSTAFRARTYVVAESCAVTVAVTVTAGVLRATRAPTAGEAVALVCCCVVVLTRVVATGMRLSVTHPHRADLRGPRDTPAPPGVMAVYSVRLAASTTLLAVLFSLLARSPDWRLPLLAAIPLVLLSLRRLVGTARMWRDDTVRSRVLTTVTVG